MKYDWSVSNGTGLKVVAGTLINRLMCYVSGVSCTDYVPSSIFWGWRRVFRGKVLEMVGSQYGDIDDLIADSRKGKVHAVDDSPASYMSMRGRYNATSRRRSMESSKFKFCKIQGVEPRR